MDEAVARVVAAREAGADASFIEAPSSVDELATIGRRAPAPNVANMIAGGRTPVLPRDELARLGFHLILYPLAGLFSAAHSLAATYAQLRREGTVAGTESQGMAFEEFNALIGVEEKYRLAERFGAG